MSSHDTDGVLQDLDTLVRKAGTRFTLSRLTSMKTTDGPAEIRGLAVNVWPHNWPLAGQILMPFFLSEFFFYLDPIETLPERTPASWQWALPGNVNWERALGAAKWLSVPEEALQGGAVDSRDSHNVATSEHLRDVVVEHERSTLTARAALKRRPMTACLRSQRLSTAAQVVLCLAWGMSQTSCAHLGSDVSTESPMDSAESCGAHDGIWTPYRDLHPLDRLSEDDLGRYVCRLPTYEGEKTCTDSRQCRGHCLAPSAAVAGEEAVGTCASYTWVAAGTKTLHEGRSPIQVSTRR